VQYRRCHAVWLSQRRSPCHRRIAHARDHAVHHAHANCTAARILNERPRLNRFVSGGRIWQRRGIFVSFSAKKQKSDKGELVALKRELDAKMSLADVVDRFDGLVGDARANKPDATDKELAVFLKLPTPVLSFAVRVAFVLDQWGLLPHSMIAGDPLFSSVFIANLGSIGMDAPFHHLYEWGNIPLFCAIGKERDDVVVTDGVPTARRVIPLKWTFDERVEDGLYCLKSLDMLREMVADPARSFS
jgi:hypothetical protein